MSQSLRSLRAPLLPPATGTKGMERWLPGRKLEIGYARRVMQAMRTLLPELLSVFLQSACKGGVEQSHKSNSPDLRGMAFANGLASFASCPSRIPSLLPRAAGATRGLYRSRDTQRYPLPHLRLLSTPAVCRWPERQVNSQLIVPRFVNLMETPNSI